MQKSFLQRVFTPPAKRSFWRGLFAGKLVQYALLLLAAAIKLISDRLLEAAHQTTGISANGPVDPNSTQWLLLQALGFVVVLCAGLAAARWSKPRSWAAVAALVAISLGVAAYMPAPETRSLFRLGLWLSLAPLGFIGGAMIYRRYERDA